MDDLLQRLAAPFANAEIDWRVGSTTGDKKKGMALAYIDARTVQDRLDAVCGPLWQCEHIVSGDKRVTCKLGIKIGDEWVWRSDGAGETDYEAEKGSYSDSFKRAAVKWRVGRYLYDLSSPWVEIEPMGKSFKIKESEKSKLDAILTRAGRSAPPQAAPSQSFAAPAVVAGLVSEGGEAADRGTDALRVFWKRLNPNQQRSIGGEPQLRAWQTRAAEIDRIAATEINA